MNELTMQASMKMF